MIALDHDSEDGAVLNQQSGQIYFFSDDLDFEEINGVPEPEDLDTNPAYIEIPSVRDLGLGKRLALDFTSQHMNHKINSVQIAFSGRGAYRQFKQILADSGLLEHRYQFEKTAKQKALNEWANSIGISILD